MAIEWHSRRELDKGSWLQDISEPVLEGLAAASDRAADVMGPAWVQDIRDIQVALETLGMQVMTVPPHHLSSHSAAHNCRLSTADAEQESILAYSEGGAAADGVPRTGCHLWKLC